MPKPIITDLKNYKSVVNQLQDELKNRGAEPELPIRTMPDLNYKLWGIHKKKLCVVGARTSNGKSMMVINLAYDLAMQQKRVLFLSLEMPTNRIIERMFCLDQHVDNIELLKNGYNKSEQIRKKFEAFKNNALQNSLVISDCIGQDWQFVDDTFKKLNTIPDVVFLDHVQEIRGNRSQKDNIDQYISKIRESAIRNNFALVVCSQVNRVSASEVDDKEPQLHHLKATGFLEEAADQVVLLHWPHHYDDSKPQEELIVNVAKNRDGMTGRIKMFYSPQHCMVRDLEKTIQVEQKPVEKVDWND